MAKSWVYCFFDSLCSSLGAYKSAPNSISIGSADLHLCAQNKRSVTYVAKILNRQYDGSCVLRLRNLETPWNWRVINWCIIIIIIIIIMLV